MKFLLNKMIFAKADHAIRIEAKRLNKEDPVAKTNKHIATSLDNCQKKLDEYYTMLDETPVYAAAIVLHPGQGWRSLEEKWTSTKQKEWLKTA